MTENHDEMMRANLRNWDARTSIHVGSEFYDLAGLRDGAERLAPFEYDELGQLAGRSLVHLQCHLGTDTVCLARAGADAAGLDLSPESVAAAGRIAADCGVDVRYEAGNVYDAADVFGDERFDVVYTGKGALVWLPDLELWARTVAALLRPGGLLYLVEFHPLLRALTYGEQPDEGLLIEYDYLPGRGAEHLDSPHTYTDGPRLAGHTVSYQWAHGLGTIVNALIGAGLRIESLAEHDILPWQRIPEMTPAGNGWWRLPESRPRIPVLFSLRAVRP
ncbi:MAG: methyltransferase domain-containing protein [Streptosporangiales bacterium]|nr:methyltransferase domain-containing protein [Streptosporangiales bacterium]